MICLLCTSWMESLLLRSFEVIAVTGASTLCTLHSSTRISRALEHKACNIVQWASKSASMFQTSLKMHLDFGFFDVFAPANRVSREASLPPVPLTDTSLRNCSICLSKSDTPIAPTHPNDHCAWCWPTWAANQTCIPVDIIAQNATETQPLGIYFAQLAVPGLHRAFLLQNFHVHCGTSFQVDKFLFLSHFAQ